MVRFQFDGKIMVRKTKIFGFCLISPQKSRRALSNWEQLIVNYV